MKNLFITLTMKNLFITRGYGDYKSHQAKIPTKSGEFYLYVIAGKGSYSSPREFVEDCSYDGVEVAIFTKNGEWATKEQASPVFPIIGEGEYAYWDDNSSTAVFGYVPIRLIPACIEVL